MRGHRHFDRRGQGVVHVKQGDSHHQGLWLAAFTTGAGAALLLKFSGDLVYLVLVRGSALDTRLGDASIDLIRAGLQRHCVFWVREMSEDNIRQVGEEGPTIDSITVAEFESHAVPKEWLGQNAPAFLR